MRSKKGSVVGPLLLLLHYCYSPAGVAAALQIYFPLVSHPSSVRSIAVRQLLSHPPRLPHSPLLTIIIIINAQMGKGRNYSTFAAGLSFFKP